MKPLRYYSEQKNYAANNGQLPFQDFVPREGPNGGRVVIRGFTVYAVSQIDISVQTQEGEDMANVIANVKVESANGRLRWNAPGDASRIMSYLLDGADRYTEHADIAAGNNNASIVRMYIPMRKRFTKNPDDWAMPADMFRKLVITSPTAASWATSGTTLAIDSLYFYVIAECYEEFDLQFHCEDYVSVQDFESLTQGKFSIDGKLHELAFHAAGASGGAALAGCTDVRIDTKNLLDLTLTSELLADYRRRRNVGSNLASTMGSAIHADPFVAGKAIPVIYSDEETSCFEGPVLRNIKVNITNDVASLRALTRVVVAPDPATRNAIASAYGVKDWGSVVVKTKSKSSKGLGDWPPTLQPFLPLKAQGVKLGAARG